MADLREFAVANARREFQPLRFPERRITPMIDPAGWSEQAIEGDTNDLIFAANEALRAGDVEALLKIQQIAERRIVHLLTLNDLALDFADRVLKAREGRS